MTEQHIYIAAMTIVRPVSGDVVSCTFKNYMQLILMLSSTPARAYLSSLMVVSCRLIDASNSFHRWQHRQFSTFHVMLKLPQHTHTKHVCWLHTCVEHDLCVCWAESGLHLHVCEMSTQRFEHDYSQLPAPLSRILRSLSNSSKPDTKCWHWVQYQIDHTCIYSAVVQSGVKILSDMQ